MMKIIDRTIVNEEKLYIFLLIKKYI